MGTDDTLPVGRSDDAITLIEEQAEEKIRRASAGQGPHAAPEPARQHDHARAAADEPGGGDIGHLHRTRDSQGMPQLEHDVRDAGGVSGTARRDIEALSGQPVVSQENYKTLRQGRQREPQPPLLGEATRDGGADAE